LHGDEAPDALLGPLEARGALGYVAAGVTG
jgi:hypothetical protein